MILSDFFLTRHRNHYSNSLDPVKQIIFVSILLKLDFIFVREGVCHLSTPESPLEKRWDFETQEQLEAHRSPV